MRILRDIAGQYRDKQVLLYFNDRDSAKTDLLREKIPKDTQNFHIEITSKNASNVVTAHSHSWQSHKHRIPQKYPDFKEPWCFSQWF